MYFVLLIGCGLSMLGMVLAALAHVLSYAGVSARPLPYWTAAVLPLLFVGAGIASDRMTRDYHPHYYWRAELRNCSPWMRRALLTMCAYACVNFVLYTIFRPAGELFHDGYISSVVMFFYATCAATLYSAALEQHSSS